MKLLLQNQALKLYEAGDDTLVVDVCMVGLAGKTPRQASDLGILKGMSRTDVKNLRNALSRWLGDGRPLDTQGEDPLHLLKERLKVRVRDLGGALSVALLLDGHVISEDTA